MSDFNTRTSALELRRDVEEFQIFMADVLTIDYERMVCTILDIRSNVPYQNVRYLPANHSSAESTDAQMPEPGSKCYAAHISAHAGFSDVAILGWVASDIGRAQQGIAIRDVDAKDLQGWNQRVRGSYRKAYPGQHTTTNSHGYSERHDDGWDRLAADFSRDYLDPDTRTWAHTTSRVVGYNDGSTTFEGPINRPGGVGLGAEVLPDGNTRQVVYLSPGAVATDRYVSGKQDVIALVEKTEKIQEFALDFPIPVEVIGTAFMDQALGTTADAWGRTTVLDTIPHPTVPGGTLESPVSYDSQSFIINQNWDHPYDSTAKSVGPTTAEGVTPCRRGYIIERSQGTLVGSNVFDPTTYGQVLKPVIFPYSKQGRFATDTHSGYLPVAASTDHSETRLAASAYSVRFPHEANTTRWDVTKEGMLLVEVGSTLPKENNPLLPQGNYEHPHGAGRSVEANLVGSLKMVIGKNRDEEEAIDLQALGQTVIRLGADDTSAPNVDRTVKRDLSTQMRGQSDRVLPRTLQYWKPSIPAGDAVNLAAKQGMENISLRGAFDGGTVLRLGARNQNSRRRHLINGYIDGPGVNPYDVNDASRIDSKTSGRPIYGVGDSVYQFHDLTQAGKPQVGQLPYYWSGSPVANMDQAGLSLDLHLVRDALLRIGRNPTSGQSLLLDLAGGIAAAVGMDTQNRSLTATLDGGVELVIGPNKQQKGLRLEIRGDVDWTIQGNWQVNVTGDIVMESTGLFQTARTDIVTKAQCQHHMALTSITHESPEILHNQGSFAGSTTDNI